MRRRKPLVAQRDELPAVSCPCGKSRRAFLVPGNATASVHWVDISRRARPHYHRRLTEIYIVVAGKGYLELDQERIPVRPGTMVLIPPGTVHRAVGKLRIINISVPPFDPADEHVVPVQPSSRRKRAKR